MTILRRWLFNVASFLLGGACGLWTVQFLESRMELPPVGGIFIVLIFMAVFVAISYHVGQSLFPVTLEEQLIRPEIPRQPWAWLKPHGEGLKPSFPMNKDQIVIGREVKCDLMLNNESVSRRHAEVVRLAEGYLLRDLGSRNGTFVNGQRVQEYVLSDGDKVAIGDIVFIFEAPRRAVTLTGQPESVSHLVGDLGGSLAAGLDSSADEDDTEVWNHRPARPPE